MLIRDGRLEDAVSLQKSVAEAKVMVYGDPSEEAAASYQMLGSIRLKQGRTEQALKWLTKVVFKQIIKSLIFFRLSIRNCKSFLYNCDGFLSFDSSPRTGSYV